MSKTLLSLALAAAVFAGAAHAGTVYPVAVETSDTNGTVLAADRDDPTVLFDAYASGDEFYSLGLGGNLVLDFGTMVGGKGTVIEVTYNLDDNYGSSLPGYNGGYTESMDVYVSASTDFSGATLVASVSNADAQLPGFSFIVSEVFRYVKLVDTTLATNEYSPSVDGFDIAEISFTPVPVPAAGLLLGGALAGLGALRRRSKKA